LRIGSSAALGTTTDFIGNILALTSITLNTGATLNGRALAQTGAVTLDANTIEGPTCGTRAITTTTTTTPKLPNTGYIPNNHADLSIIAIGSLAAIAAVSVLFVAIRKKRTI
jgi:hypothetical protein